MSSTTLPRFKQGHIYKTYKVGDVEYRGHRIIDDQYVLLFYGLEAGKEYQQLQEVVHLFLNLEYENDEDL